MVAHLLLRFSNLNIVRQGRVSMGERHFSPIVSRG
jgi:hypothetical protein